MRLAIGIALLAISALPGEDYSPLGGVVFAPEVSWSQGRKLGFGADATLIVLFLDASVVYDHFPHPRDYGGNLVTGYVGVGLANVVMAQVGGNPDGFAGRLHGDLSISGLMRGQALGLASDHQRIGFLRRDVVLSYSLGYERAGALGALGIGVLY